MRAMTLAMVVGVGLLATGCRKVSSENYKTSALYPSFEVVGDGADTTVSAHISLESSPLTFVELRGEDQLSAVSGGTSVRLSRTLDGLGMVYYGTILAGSEGERSVRIALDRGLEDVSAPNSVATLPGAFLLTAPAGGASFSRQTDAIIVEWGPSGSSDSVVVSASGSCFTNYTSGATADTGSFIIPAGALAGTTTATCPATFRVDKRRPGTLDPAFKAGGNVIGIQRRGGTFTSTP